MSFPAGITFVNLVWNVYSETMNVRVRDRDGIGRDIKLKWYSKHRYDIPANWPEIIAAEVHEQMHLEKNPINRY